MKTQASNLPKAGRRRGSRYVDVVGTVSGAVLVTAMSGFRSGQVRLARAQQLDLCERDGGEDDEEDDGEGRGVPELVPGEGQVVDVVVDDLSLIHISEPTRP